jgi:hypothetical protein
MENKFIPGQRVVLATHPNNIIHPPDTFLEINKIYHVQGYCPDFMNNHDLKMITLKEKGDIQYLEKLFKPAKRQRLKAARIRLK